MRSARGSGISVCYWHTMLPSCTPPPQCGHCAGRGTSMTSSTLRGTGRRHRRPYWLPALRPGFAGAPWDPAERRGPLDAWPIATPLPTNVAVARSLSSALQSLALNGQPFLRFLVPHARLTTLRTKTNNILGGKYLYAKQLPILLWHLLRERARR